jgi:hypothetical protein
MGKTHKDKPDKLKYSEHYSEVTKPKKRKQEDTEWHWMTTPSEWNKVMNNRPERKAAKQQLRVIPDNVEEVDIPDTGYKPHSYYW